MVKVLTDKHRSSRVLVMFRGKPEEGDEKTVSLTVYDTTAEDLKTLTQCLWDLYASNEGLREVIDNLIEIRNRDETENATESADPH